MEDQKAHFLLVTFPAQGHINPALVFAKRLLQAGARVTFATSVSAHRRMGGRGTIPDGLVFATFSDGYDDGFGPIDGDIRDYLSTFRQRGAESLAALFEKSAAEGNPITCLVYTLLLPWAAKVAREYHVPNAMLWIQPATVLDVYYYYFNGYKSVISECENDPSWSLKLPKLPLELKSRDLPSFLLPSRPDPYYFALPSFQEQFELLDMEENPKILVNTFDELEPEALRSIERVQLIPIGPLLPSAFLDGRDPSDKSFGGDLFQHRREDGDYLQWLDIQETSSVIYVSFGSISVLSKPQMEELGRALLQTHRPFLWVIREKDKKKQSEAEKEAAEEDQDELDCMVEVKQQGLIVKWCSQVEVLSHPSIGCFVTHCGWNSTLESLASGVPVVAFPQWTDQTTNAGLVEGLWKTGVRVEVSQDEGLVKSEEIKRCLEVVMESEEMRENAKRWRKLAVEAAKEGGSSNNNLKAFIEEVIDHHSVTSK